MADSDAVTTGQLVMVAVAVFAAGFVQVLAGFGFALLAMPLMTLSVPVDKAVVVSSLLGVVTSGWQAVHLRADRDPELVKRLVGWAHLGMPLGLLVLLTVPDQAMKVILGVAVLIATALLIRQINLSHVGPGLDRVCGFLSGILNTSLSTNGPPLVFDLQARHFDAARFRATLVSTFALCYPVTLTLFIVSGKVNRDGVIAALIAAPALVLGQALAWPLRRHVHGQRFRRLVISLLFAAGASTIVFAVT